MANAAGRNRSTCRVTGVPLHTFVPTLEHGIEYIHADFRFTRSHLLVPMLCVGMKSFYTRRFAFGNSGVYHLLHEDTGFFC